MDGSILALPCDTALKQHYGMLGSRADSPSAQASVLYDVLNNVVVDARIAPLKTHERMLAVEHFDALKTLGQTEKELVLSDRGYPSSDMLQELQGRNIRYIMRVSKSFNAQIDALPHGDAVITTKIKGKEYTLRVVKFTLESGEEETLLTDLFDPSLTVEDFRNLYFMRWAIETKFGTLKNKLEIENFSGRTVNAIEQDFFVTMYLCNIAAAAAWEADEKIAQNRKDKSNRYLYKTNVNHEIGVLKDQFILALLHPGPYHQAYLINKIINRIAKAVTPIKPGRNTPRPKSPRESKFHHNHKSNC